MAVALMYFPCAIANPWVLLSLIRWKRIVVCAALSGAAGGLRQRAEEVETQSGTLPGQM